MRQQEARPRSTKGSHNRVPLRWLSAATRLPDEALTLCGKARYLAPLRHHAPLRRGVDHANSAMHCSVRLACPHISNSPLTETYH